jgi:hypothetical protein
MDNPSTSWRQAVQMFPNPIAVKEGEQFSLLAKHYLNVIFFEPAFVGRG